MPKHGFLTPKAIGNRIKAKGLQKLRWYCEMCQKQCRDENGFKCHQTSEGHLRQMRVFSENPHAVMERYSEEFEQNFLETLSRLHNTKRVHANIVYKEYIADKQHVHMNSTKWSTLTNFVLYLGKKGLVVADETEKGWYISWIDRDPAVIARQEAAERKRKNDMDDEARRQREIKRRVQAAEEAGVDTGASEASGMHRADNEAKVSLKIAPAGCSAFSGASSSDAPQAKKPKVSTAFGDESSSSSAASSSTDRGGKVSALDAIMRQEELRKRQLEASKAQKAQAEMSSSSSSSSSTSLSLPDVTVRKGYWLFPGLIVKVMNKKVGDGKFYKAKAVVLQVLEKYVAIVRILPTEGDPPPKKGAKLQIDQEDLQTVVPKVGNQCRLVNGCGRGCLGVAERVRVDDFCVDVRVTDDSECSAQGPNAKSGETGLLGVVLERIEYEDLCKVRDESH